MSRRTKANSVDSSTLSCEVEKEYIKQQEINNLLGKSSLSILEQKESIIILCKFQQLKTGGLTANLAKVSELPNTNVPLLHVFSVFWSTLLPATIVQHLRTFSPQVIEIEIAKCVAHKKGIKANKNTQN